MDGLDDERAQFQTALYAVLQRIAVPEPMEPRMLRDVRTPIEEGYPWPTSTIATFVALVAAVVDADDRRRKWRAQRRRRCEGTSAATATGAGGVATV